MIDLEPTSWLDRRAMESPDRIALCCGTVELNYGDLARRAGRVAASMRERGVLPGQVVALLVESGVAFVELFHAVGLCGAIALPLHLRLTAAEIGYQLRDSGASWLVHGDAALRELARKAAGEAPGIVRVAISEAMSDGPDPPAAGLAPRRRACDPLAILYTSGTSGRPKGALLSIENFHASAVASAELLGANADDRWLACLPLYHVGGLSILLRSLLGGSSVLIHPRFEPDAVGHALDRDGVTVVSLVATMLDRVLAARGPRPAPSSLRCVLLGGGPAPVPLLERARALGFPVAPTYGLTEATSQVATRLPGDDTPPLDGRLRALPGTEVRILGEDGRTLPTGATGEIAVRGPTVMRGYLNQEPETARALRDGWLHTGDLGRIDTAGLLEVFDRRSDLIVSGGENVYPAEVEGVLLRHPRVAEVAVVGVRDDRYGERPVAWVVATEAAAVDASELDAFCRQQLAPFKVPVAFRPIDALPRTSAGKLLRRDLRERPDPAA